MKSWNEKRKAAAFSGRRNVAYRSRSRGVSALSNGIALATYAYDSRSRRVKKVTPEATTTFFYDDWNLIEERVAYTNGTSSTIRYYWGKDISGTLQGAGGVGGLLYIAVSNSNSQLQLYIPFYDAYGNVLGYCDAQGNVVARYTYDASGNTVSQSGPLAEFFSFRFSTKYFDSESGLYYYGYRYYRPETMTWMTEDPIEEEGGLNLYGFCGNDAVGHYDALGQSWLGCFGKCVEEWRLDWSKIFTSANVLLSSNVPVPKTPRESVWIKDGVSKDTTYLSRAISKGVQLAMKLPLGNPIRAKLISTLKEVRHFMRKPAMIGAGSACAVLTVFEGFYDIGTMLYCAGHCFGK